MDKYEYKLKLEQLKELVDENRYLEAAELADEINWNKVRSVSTLCMVGRIYEARRRYEDARDIFALAYDRSPVSKTALSHLTSLSVRLGNLHDAQDYYEEFIQCAPRDRVRYEMAYEIAKLKDASLDERIAILEEFKEKEFTEEWGLELAKLYHEAGMEDECVAACDEIFIWFGEGDCVRQALELKEEITPLSELQQKRLPILQEQSRLAWEEEQRRREQERLEAEQRELARLEKERQEALRREEERRLAAEEGREYGDRDVDRMFPEKNAKWQGDFFEDKESRGDYDANNAGKEMVGAAVGKFKKFFQNVSNMQKRAEDEFDEEEEAFLEDLEKAGTGKRGEADPARDQAAPEGAPARTGMTGRIEVTGSISQPAEPLPESEGKPIEEEILKQAISETDLTKEAVAEEDRPSGRISLKDRLTSRIPFFDGAKEARAKEEEISVEETLQEWEGSKAGLDAAIDAVSREEAPDERRAAAAREMRDIMARLTELQAILQPEEAEAKPIEEAKEAKRSAIDAASSPAAAALTEQTAGELSEAKREVAAAAEKAVEELEKARLADQAARETEDRSAEAAIEAEPEVEGELGAEAVETEVEAAETEEETAEPEVEAVETDAEADETEVVTAEPEMGEAAEAGPADDGDDLLEEIEPEDDLLEEIEPEEEDALDADYFGTGSGVEKEAKPNAEAEAVSAETQPEAEAEAGLAEAQPEAEVVPAESQPKAEAEVVPTEDQPEAEGPESDPAAGTPLAQEPDDFRPLTDTQKEMFSYFVSVPGLTRQISKALEGAAAKSRQARDSVSGNVVIQGPAGIGKTVLATNLIKAIQLENGKEKSKIGKISAASLNKRDFASLLDKVKGGYLIIEKAGGLEAETVKSMSQVMDGDTDGLLIVLEDTAEGIAAVLEMDPGFAAKFTETITVPEFSVDDLVAFGKSYAYEMECVIDEMGVLALHTRIQNIQKIDHATMLAEVKEIIDEAIDHAENHGKRRFGRRNQRYTSDDYLILREEDMNE